MPSTEMCVMHLTQLLRILEVRGTALIDIQRDAMTIQHNTGTLPSQGKLLVLQIY